MKRKTNPVAAFLAAPKTKALPLVLRTFGEFDLLMYNKESDSNTLPLSIRPF